jgi:hypothetical protein
VVGAETGLVMPNRLLKQVTRRHTPFEEEAVMDRTELAPPARSEHAQAPDATAAKGTGCFVQHVSPAGRDVRYDAASGEATLPVSVHYPDGSTVDTDLLLEPSQVLAFGMQVERAVQLREKARGAT